jgi:poly(A) polymerase
MNKSANEVFELSRKTLSIPRMVQIGIRNIWLLQFRFQKTGNKKVFFTLEHPRFRAAYDFLLLRKHESPQMQSLGDWWTHIQTLSRSKQRELIFQKKRVSKR